MQQFENVNNSLLEILACPRDRSRLSLDGDSLLCESSHRYPIVRGIPVLLVPEAAPTQWVFGQSIRDAYFPSPEAPEIVESVGDVDDYVQATIVKSSGNLYRPLIGKLARHPIPQLRLPRGDGRTFLDVGCNWGRWSIAAARLGYRTIGIDPNLSAVEAARRVARKESVDCDFIVADARHIPFTGNSIDTVFSYSVLQHFARTDVSAALAEFKRVLKYDGVSLVQMANAAGVRSAFQQMRRGFREPIDFEVRYWSVASLLEAFNDSIGPSEISADCFFGLGIQAADRDLLPFFRRLLVSGSELFRRATRFIPILTHFSDSIYIASRKANQVA